MEKKKLIQIIMALLAIGLFVGVYYFIFSGGGKNLKNKEMAGNDTRSSVSFDLPKTECNYDSDQAAYTKAVEIADINTCSCIKEEKMREVCEYTANDLAIYLEAIKQYNPKMCDGIQETSRKEACVSITQSGVDNLKKNDPQYLANVYALAHSDQAIEEYEVILQKDASSVSNLIALSLAYAEKGLNEQVQGRSQAVYVEKALATLEKAKAIDANNSDIYRVEGYAYEIKPDNAKAIESYDKSIKLNEKNILAYAGRGHANSISGSNENALRDFNKAAELDIKKEYGIIYSNLCRLGFSSSKNINDQIKNCQIAIGEKNDITLRSESLQILASLYFPIKQYSQANNYLMKAKVLTPNDPNLHVSYANLYLAQREFKKAEESARKAIELAPTKTYAYLTLSYALKDQENFSAALEAANKSLSLIDGDVSLLAENKVFTKKTVYYSLADLYQFTNDKDQEMKYKNLGDAIK